MKMNSVKNFPPALPVSSYLIQETPFSVEKLKELRSQDIS